MLVGRILVLLAIWLMINAIEEVHAQKVVPAEEVITKIENSVPAVYDNVIIVGNISSPNLDLPAKYIDWSEYGIETTPGTIGDSKIISSPIMITNSKIQGDVVFTGIIFQEPIYFSNTTFLGASEFALVSFNSDAIFDRSNFVDPALFWNSEFDGITNFDDAKFWNEADFTGAKFKNSPQFWNAKFNETARFTGATFGKIAYFGGTQFNKYVYFVNTQFKNDAFFGGAHQFNGTANFGGALFENEALFGDGYINNVDFSSAKFNGKAVITNAHLNGNLILNDTEINTIQLSNVTFTRNARIFLQNTDFKKFLVQWDSIKDHLIDDGAAYLNLIRNFKDMEQFDDADNCYYQYRDWRFKERSISEAKIEDFISWVACGYGVRGLNTLLSGLAIMLLFGIYFSWRDRIYKSTDKLKKAKELFFFSLVVLVSAPLELYKNTYTEQRLEVLSIRHKYAIVIERLLGWGLLVILIGVASRLMIRY